MVILDDFGIFGDGLNWVYHSSQICQVLCLCLGLTELHDLDLPRPKSNYSLPQNPFSPVWFTTRYPTPAAAGFKYVHSLCWLLGWSIQSLANWLQKKHLPTSTLESCTSTTIPMTIFINFLGSLIKCGKPSPGRRVDFPCPPSGCECRNAASSKVHHLETEVFSLLVPSLLSFQGSQSPNNRLQEAAKCSQLQASQTMLHSM